MRNKRFIFSPFCIFLFGSFLVLTFTVKPNNTNAENILKIGGAFELSGANLLLV
ncbi:MAG: hypothetical protein LUQ65_08540 [Candidatus Helarchaeota archaeon]|nr:hypothetical protein [Candidatus Helarchaeota archaeon]